MPSEDLGSVNPRHELYMYVQAILVSTVSSQSAFNTWGRILDSFCSSLSPTTVEALICVQNWLRSTKQNVNNLQVEINEAKKIELDV